MNFGLIGFGLSGEVFHLPVINAVDGLQVKSVFTRSLEKKEKINAKYPEIEVYDNVEDVLNDEVIDVIVISLPNKLHFEIGKKALNAGKHVIIEKPFTVSSIEANELIELAKVKNKMLTVYHNRRYDSDFLTIKKLLEEKAIGRVVEYQASYNRYRKEVKFGTWKEDNLPGSGYLYDLGSHLIDQALCLFGMPDEVYCDIQKQRTGALADDSFELTMYYNGLKAIIKSSNLVSADLPRYIILGEDGSIVKFGLDVQEDDLRKGLIPNDDGSWGRESEEYYLILNSENSSKRIESEPGDYRRFYMNVANSITNLEKLNITAVDGYNVIKIIELAMESNKLKKRVKI
ncbi:MAG: Gfo/Idh/MocA family oxidoreductase [Clostridiales bacterium]|nr:Gfo/Idh/MocA family oxidoreductase [Clostridiales bacterium]